MDSPFEHGLAIVPFYRDRRNGSRPHRSVSRGMDQDKDAVHTCTSHLPPSSRGMRGSVSAGLGSKSAVDGCNWLGRCRTLVRWSFDWPAPARPILHAAGRLEVSFEPSVHASLWGLVSELSNPA
jgi:hypothetical protein